MTVDLWLVWENGHNLFNYLEQSSNVSHCCSQQLKRLPLKNHAHLYGQYMSMLKLMCQPVM